jgi:hypothetical protein
MELPYEIRTASPEVQAHYRHMIEDGQTERFAIMCALRQAPGTKGSDRAFQEGRLDQNHMQKLPKRQQEWMLRECRAAGIQTKGRIYMSGLADKRGHLDQEAWVSDTSDVLRVAKKRRLEVRGVVNYTPPEGVAPPKRVPLNPKLVSRLAKAEMAKEPGLTRTAAEQRIRERHTPHWHKKRK